MINLQNLDIAFSDFLSKIFPHNKFFENFFSFLSGREFFILIWIIFFLIFLIKEKKDKTLKYFLIYFVLSVSSGYILSNLILKNLFMRVRPWISFGYNLNLCPSDYSFPSGHATVAFAGAVIFQHFDKKRGSLYYLIAIGISYSRIYLYCHYFMDVLFGALVGFTVGFIVIKFLSWNFDKKS